MFWLDAHYSYDHQALTAKGELDTPIIEELRLILAHSVKNHVILIDDSSWFGIYPSYPTIDQLKKFVLKINPNLVIRIKNNIIRIYPRQ